MNFFFFLSGNYRVVQNNETVVVMNCFVNYTLTWNSKLFTLWKLYFFASVKKIILKIVAVVIPSLMSWAAVGWSWKLWLMHYRAVSIPYSDYFHPSLCQSCDSGIMWGGGSGPGFHVCTEKLNQLSMFLIEPYMKWLGCWFWQILGMGQCTWDKGEKKMDILLSRYSALFQFRRTIKPQCYEGWHVTVT